MAYEQKKFYKKWLDEQEYVENFTSRGEVVPPSLVFQPYEIRNGRPGYLVPCDQNDPEAEEYYY